MDDLPTIMDRLRRDIEAACELLHGKDGAANEYARLIRTHIVTLWQLVEGLGETGR